MADKKTPKKPASRGMPEVKRVFIISDEAMRRCAEAGLRTTMPSPNDTDRQYTFDLQPGGSIIIRMRKGSEEWSRFQLPAAAFIAELR